MAEEVTVRVGERNPKLLICGEYTATFKISRESIEEGASVECVIRGPGLSGYELSYCLPVPIVEGALRALARAYDAGKEARSSEILQLLGGRSNKLMGV